MLTKAALAQAPRFPWAGPMGRAQRALRSCEAPREQALPGYGMADGLLPFWSGRDAGAAICCIG